MARPAPDPADDENTPDTDPSLGKTAVDKATATEDLLPKEEEEPREEEEALMMPPTSLVMLEAEPKCPPQPTLEEEEGEEETETPAPQLAPEDDTPTPPSTFEELVVSGCETTSSFSSEPSLEELTVLQRPLENVSQPQPLKEPTVLQPLPLKEPLVPPKEEPDISCGPPEEDQPVLQAPPLKLQPPLPKEPTYSQAALLFKEPEEPLVPPVEVPFMPQSAPKQTWSMKEVSAAPVVVYAKPKAICPVQKRQEAVDETWEDFIFPLWQPGHCSQSSSMANSIDCFIKSPVGQVFVTTIDRALEKSQEWLDYYLPVIEYDDETDYYKAAAEKCPSEDLCKEGCFMRISSLSSKVRDRAFKLALHHLKTTRQNTNENLSLLDHILHLLEHPDALTLPNVSEQLQNIWTEWTSTEEDPRVANRSRCPSILPELELKALELTKTLAQQLYNTYQNLLPHIADIPAHLRDKVIQVYEGLEEIHSRFSSGTLKDLPTNFATQSRQKMASAKETLDELVDFVVLSPPICRLSQLASSSTAEPPATDLQTKMIEAENTDEEESSNSLQPALLPTAQPSSCSYPKKAESEVSLKI